ncbi:MAG: hypothetical protein K0Q73_2772 [Paenibacillus sp.]|jgi:hypothetical protein|nr:hypothetical protein [Paenibacillus sp.]
MLNSLVWSYHKNGLTVPLNDIFPNKVCQLHFVVTWSDFDHENYGTWYAVDMNPETIMNSSKLT